MADRATRTEDGATAAANVNANANRHDTMLHRAVLWNDTVTVQHLVQRGAHVHGRNLGQQTPLHVAVSCGFLDMTELLQTHGADPNARDRRGRTSLHLAVALDAKAHDTVNLLLANGADVNAQDAEGFTALHLVMGRQQVLPAWKTKLVGRLLHAGANVFAARAGNYTVLHDALRDGSIHDAHVAVAEQTSANNLPFRDIGLERNTAAIALLLQAGADPNAVTTAGATPLSLAITYGGVQIVEQLIQAGADVDGYPGRRRHLLTALACGKYAVANVLVNAGANIQVQDANGREALALAVSAEKPWHLLSEDNSEYALYAQQTLLLVRSLVALGATWHGQPVLNAPVDVATLQSRLALVEHWVRERQLGQPTLSPVPVSVYFDGPERISQHFQSAVRSTHYVT